MGMFGNPRNQLRQVDPPFQIDGIGGPMNLPRGEIGDLPTMTPALKSPDMPVWKAALGGLFDAIATQTGGQATFVPTMLARQAEERQNENAFARWQRQYDYERANPKPSTAQPYRFEDNAGNVWEVGPTGDVKRIFTDRVPKMYVQGDQAIQIDNPFLNDASPAAPSAPQRPVGKLTPITGGPTQPASGGFRP